MNISEFVSKWQKVELTERSASQQHFLDLCELFDHPKPAQDDPSGERFTFEKGAAKHGGGKGCAVSSTPDALGCESSSAHASVILDGRVTFTMRMTRVSVPLSTRA